MPVIERIRLEEPNGRKFTKVAKGATAVAAAAFGAAIINITCGTVVSGTVTTDFAPADLPVANGGAYSDATFHFRKGTENANVHFEQLTNAVAESIDGVATGNVDITNADVQGYAAAWSTANGGGWSLVEAHYVR